MRTLLLFLLPCLAAAAGEPALRGPSVAVKAVDQDRKWVLASTPLPRDMTAPVHLVDESGAKIPGQVSDGTVRWLIPEIAKGTNPKFTLESGAAPSESTVTLANEGDFVAVKVGNRLVTRYHNGRMAKEHMKPFWYPLMVGDVNITRSYPMEDRAGEARDHPHHTAIYHTHDQVNGMNFWSKKDPIMPLRVMKVESGPAFARLAVEHGWGRDLVETQDVMILNTGEDTIMDWTITMKATHGDVTFGKTKEGGFSCRVTTGLTNKNGGKVRLVDAMGNKGEPAIRKHAAPWVDYYGKVDGKVVGVAIMDHPSSFRYPTTWHVRGYGCFAANRYFVNGAVTLKKGDSFTMRYRLYAHNGDVKKAKVKETWAGFAHTAVEGK